MRSIYTAMALLILALPCQAQDQDQNRNMLRSWTLTVGEHNFRIPTEAFFTQLEDQFCRPSWSAPCYTNLSELKYKWFLLTLWLQTLEIKSRTDPFAGLKAGAAVGDYDSLNAQVLRFIETNWLETDLPE